jgi:tripeptide aminopeptidase
MLNANAIAFQFTKMLPPQEIPELTEGYEGFFHLSEMQGTVEEARLTYVVRDFDAEHFEQRLQQLQDIADELNKQYDKDLVHLEIKRQFRNMREVVEPQKHIVDLAEQAMKEV